MGHPIIPWPTNPPAIEWGPRASRVLLVASTVNRIRLKDYPPPGKTMNSKALVASILAFGAGILSGLSALSPWWTLSGSGGGVGSLSIGFLPGGSFSASDNGTTASFSYASQGVGQIGALYEGILALTVLIMLISFVVGGLGLLRTFKGNRQGGGMDSVQVWAVCVLILAVVAILVVPLAQPGVIAMHPAGLCASQSGLKTPCNSFWGSVSANGATLSWGADLGWYLEIATVAILIAALLTWRRAILEPWVTPTAYPVPSATPPSIQVCLKCGTVRTSPQPFCPACGTVYPTSAPSP
jgi:hypothetical protein